MTFYFVSSLLSFRILLEVKYILPSQWRKWTIQWDDQFICRSTYWFRGILYFSGLLILSIITTRWLSILLDKTQSIFYSLVWQHGNLQKIRFLKEIAHLLGLSSCFYFCFCFCFCFWNDSFPFYIAKWMLCNLEINQSIMRYVSSPSFLDQAMFSQNNALSHDL